MSVQDGEELLIEYHGKYSYSVYRKENPTDAEPQLILGPVQMKFNPE
jgi:hypothetical protein